MSALREFTQVDAPLSPEQIKFLAMRALLMLTPAGATDLVSIFATSIAKGQRPQKWTEQVRKEQNGSFYDRGKSDPATLKKADGGFICEFDADSILFYGNNLDYDVKIIYASDQCEYYRAAGRARYAPQ
jgi:hypothetical protein